MNNKLVATIFALLLAVNAWAQSDDGAGASPEDQSEQASSETVDAVTKVKLQVMQHMFMPDKFDAKKNQKVELTLQSLDVAHGIYIPEFEFKLEVGPKETKTGEFTPDKDGKFPFEDTTDATNKGTINVKK